MNIKKIMLVLIICMVMTVSSTACTMQIPKAERPSQPRIISTSVSICEITDRLNLDLVGVPQSAFQLPKRYRDVPRVGLPMSPDMEIIKSLKPTEIISPNSLQYDLQPKYDSIQVDYTFMDLMSVEGMLKSVEGLGEKYDRKAEADEIIKDYNEFMENYQREIAGQTKPRVLILMGLPGSYMVATEKSYVGSLVKLAGAQNVFAGEQAFLNLNTEAISKTDPDIILRAAHGMPEEVKESFAKEFRENDIWKHFRAVQNDKVYDLDYNLFNMSADLDYQEALNCLKKYFYE